MMERLWAPWRLGYIREGDKEGCFLCRILAEDDDRGNLLLKRGKSCGIVMNRYPYNNGHLMVFPFRHVAEPGLLNPGEKQESMDLAIEAVAALREVGRPDGFNIGVNLGRAAGAGVEEHLHTHIVPRWAGDTNYMPVVGAVKVIPQSLPDLWDELYPVLNR